MTESLGTQLLFCPPQPELRFLPEGPYPLGSGRFSWVAIQHGSDATNGSLCLFDITNEQHQSFNLSGRPGFAFPCDHADKFVIGMERELGIFDIQQNSWTPFAAGIDAAVNGTIVNDGVVFEEGLIFGSKDLQFAEKKAGLYFWRATDRQLFELRDDQICSNGKIVVREDDGWRLFDIDTPTQCVVSYRLNTEQGALSDERVVVDLKHLDMFPDGMVLTPDGQSLVVAFYNPNDVATGQAQQFAISSGQLQRVWQCELSPRVTCPQWIEYEGRVHLVLTTAIEHMPEDQQSRYKHAGCLFCGDSDYERIEPAAVFKMEWLN